jgi:hypothetical protein
MFKPKEKNLDADELLLRLSVFCDEKPEKYKKPVKLKVLTAKDIKKAQS